MGSSQPTTRERWHGTAGGYTNHACRCDACRRAWNDYHRDYLRAYRARKFSGLCPTPGCPRKQSKALMTGFCVPCSYARRFSDAS